jgi:hypothetical protein
MPIPARPDEHVLLDAAAALGAVAALLDDDAAHPAEITMGCACLLRLVAAEVEHVGARLFDAQLRRR